MANSRLKTNWIRVGLASLIASAVGLWIFGMMLSPAIADSLPAEMLEITAFRNPNCGCCSAWLDYMKAEGFTVKDNLVEEMESVKLKHGVPDDLATCHTALVGGYVVEGHVPVEDVKRLLMEKPNIAGISVPGMPIGSPGMESEDINETEPYTVFSFDQAGDLGVFQNHSS